MLLNTRGVTGRCPAEARLVTQCNVLNGLAVSLAFLAVPALASDLPEMVRIPGTTLSVARTETTVGQWNLCVAEGGCPAKPKLRWPEDAMPMTGITAAEAEAYAAWLSARSGQRYRLPSVTEWALAARGGTATLYWWGDSMLPGHAVCHQCDPRFVHRPAPVGTMAPNPYGLHDMNGNVWEWTADCAEPDCRFRWMAGGSWYFVPFQSRSDSKARQNADEPSYDVGFRVVRD